MSQIVSLLNSVRSNPDRAAASLYADLKGAFSGNDMSAFGKKIQTFEGVKALDDLNNFLKIANRSGALVESPALIKAAESIAKQKGFRGNVEHEKPRVINEKVESVSKMEGKVGELICLGTNSAEETVSYFLIDDGLASRKRRRMLLDPEYKYIGVGSSNHAVYGTVTVILLAQHISQ